MNVTLTPHFSIAEFACHDGTPVPARSLHRLRLLCRDYLEPLRAEFGPVHVNSGHRDRAYNARVGGAPRSQHVYGAFGPGVAADVHCERGSVAAWYDFLDRLGAGGLGRYPTWVHVRSEEHTSE